MTTRTALAIALLTVAPAIVTPAAARPPTATVSPGYDARLIESRKALAQPVAVPHSVPPQRHGKRTPKRHR